ncbi:MAG: ATP-binding protein [Hamadaea sp.]|uniref:ATP-binding protein n=1 Tax=Hamadaea sp. TaxID=2024425 RepID=UPI0017C03025|nr:ATP-binding protein [Hamadaea sp.]NUR50613.1 ATP-binding protein [Hamadaea sp.]NUR70299.1 ATP-binding protein [Hamadaea sp.]NUT19375.1 ATP-binding protein [Hamadaea sp.]
MATVRLEFTPEPVYVRTARLVGVAVARRAGLPEDRLDEVRLAIGEACGRAVTRHLRHNLRAPVLVEMRDENPYTVLVTDRAPDDAASDMEEEITVEASLALLSGVAEELEVRQAPDGGGSVVRMSWTVRPSRARR